MMVIIDSLIMIIVIVVIMNIPLLGALIVGPASESVIICIKHKTL